MHADAVVQGTRVVIVDDLLATGGTAAATVELVRAQGGKVVGDGVRRRAGASARARRLAVRAGRRADPLLTPMRGRYAPSPTGAMHLGNARTALLAWLDARAAGGAFVMRDRGPGPRAHRRRRRGAAARRSALARARLGRRAGRAAGGGPFAPYRQSERTRFYDQAVIACSPRARPSRAPARAPTWRARPPRRTPRMTTSLAIPAPAARFRPARSRRARRRTGA